MAARFGLITVLVLLLAGFAQAQQYQRLHVRSFTLSSDTASPQLEQPFHVTLTIRVTEKVSDISNVFLPTFSGAEELGDLRQTAQDRTGTTYRETLTLVAHTRGMLTVSEAYLDAIDARDGKPKRFLSNSLELPVGGGPISSTWQALRTAAIVVIDFVLVGAAVFVIVAIFWRRRHAGVIVQPPVIPPPVPPRIVSQPKDEVEEAWEQLGVRRDRASVLSLRAALWRRIGAGLGETLGDALRRPAAAQPDMRRLLLVVERAAFVEQARLDEAIEEVLCSPR